MIEAIGNSAVEWQPCFRIVPSRFPPISLFEAVVDPADLEAVYEIEAMTNDRLSAAGAPALPETRRLSWIVLAIRKSLR